MDNGETYIISFTEDELYLLQDLVNSEYQYLQELGQKESGMQKEDYDNMFYFLESITRKLVDSTYVDNPNRSKERLKNV